MGKQMSQNFQYYELNSIINIDPYKFYNIY